MTETPHPPAVVQRLQSPTGMRVIGAFAHGIIDYAVVIMLAIGPAVAGFRGRQALWAYAFALVLFLLTVATRFPLGASKIVGFPLHGAIELLLAVVMIVLPFIAGFSAGVHSRNFYIAIGVLIAIIFLLTDYRGRAARAPKS
jgi:hypothetical protein